MSTPRLVLQGKRTEKFQLKIVEPETFVERVGADVAVSFFKCLAGADLVLSFEHFIVLNHQHVRRDSVAYDRNLRTCFFMLASTMYEVGSALQELCNAKIIEKMKDRGPWVPLNELRGKWNNGRVAGILRNQVGYHLGERSFWKDGLANLKRQRELIIGSSDGDLRLDLDFNGVRDVLYSALPVDERELEKTMSDTRDAHMNLPELLVTAFAEVAKTAGIDVVDERTG